MHGFSYISNLTTTKELIETEGRMVAAGGWESGGTGEKMVKGHRYSVRRCIIYSMVINVQVNRLLK